jgi:Xaa-Pro aminopeptidase
LVKFVYFYRVIQNGTAHHQQLGQNLKIETMKTIEKIEKINNGFLVNLINEYEEKEEIAIVEINSDQIRICKRENEIKLAKKGSWYDLAGCSPVHAFQKIKEMSTEYFEVDIFSQMMRDLNEGDYGSAINTILIIAENDTESCIEAQKDLFESVEKIRDLENKKFHIECDIENVLSKRKRIINILMPDENN